MAGEGLAKRGRTLTKAQRKSVSGTATTRARGRLVRKFHARHTSSAQTQEPAALGNSETKRDPCPAAVSAFRLSRIVPLQTIGHLPHSAIISVDAVRAH